MEIYNNFLSDAENVFISDTLSGHGWKFGAVSNDDLKPIWMYDKDLAKPAVDMLVNKLDGYELVRYDINGQTKGQDTAYHNDLADGTATHSLVYYPNEWHYMWGGRLHIFLDNDIACITPQKNLAVLFDSMLWHYAEGPTENVLRVSIGLKLRKQQ
jgi:Rps23 Pro-64 3,4-dihydroxylase Tpa1-like proline 4-hydroxylase